MRSGPKRMPEYHHSSESTRENAPEGDVTSPAKPHPLDSTIGPAGLFSKQCLHLAVLSSLLNIWGSVALLDLGLGDGMFVGAVVAASWLFAWLARLA